MKEDITTDLTDSENEQGIFGNLDEMGTFQEKYKLPKLMKKEAT